MAEAIDRTFKTPELKRQYDSAVERYGEGLGSALYDHAYRPMIERIHSAEINLNRTPFHIVVFRELRSAMAIGDEQKGAKALHALEEAAIEIAAKSIRLDPPERLVVGKS